MSVPRPIRTVDSSGDGQIHVFVGVEEIATLQRVRTLLSENGGKTSPVPFGFGAIRPKRKPVQSEEAGAKILAAQKDCWAKQKAAQKSAER